MTTQPLTHHEILALIAPFTRSGRGVDLAASNRIDRQLAFRPVQHAAGAAPVPLTETLLLENPRPDLWRLTRTLTLEHGLQATATSQGAQPGELLALIETLPLERHFQAGAGYLIARSYRLEAQASGPGGATPAPVPLLTQGQVQVAGLTLTLEPPTVRGMRADVRLRAGAGRAPCVPEDLLAVQGRRWGVLSPGDEAWRGALKLSGNAVQRSRQGELRLLEAAQHLAAVLARSPRDFHAQLRRERWQVYVRRALPLLAGLALIAAAALLPHLNLAPDSALRMLIFNSPPLLLIVFFCLREMPRVEIPPLPRPLATASWTRDER